MVRNWIRRNVKIPHLSKGRMTLIFLSLFLIVILLSGFAYRRFSLSTFSNVIGIISIFLTLLAGFVGIFPYLLYKHSTFLGDYVEFKEFDHKIYQAHKKLGETNILKEEDTGFDELCHYLIDKGDIEPPASDKSTIEMTPSPQMIIKVDGESSGETYMSVGMGMELLNEGWEEFRDEEERRRDREYSILGFLILFLAIFVQALQLLV